MVQGERTSGADLMKSLDGVMIFLPERPLKTREMTCAIGAS